MIVDVYDLNNLATEQYDAKAHDKVRICEDAPYEDAEGNTRWRRHDVTLTRKGVVNLARLVGLKPSDLEG